MPAAAVYQSAIDRVICYSLGTDLNLYINFWDGQNWVRQSLGTPAGIPSGATLAPTTGLAAIYQSAIDRVMCFAVGSNNNLYLVFWDGRNWVWQAQGTPPFGKDIVLVPTGLAAVYQSAIDRVMCFAVGSNQNLFINSWEDDNWIWRPLVTPALNLVSVAAVYQSSIDRIVCFAGGGDGHLNITFWDKELGQWDWQDLGTPGVNLVSTVLTAIYQKSIDRTHLFCRRQRS